MNIALLLIGSMAGAMAYAATIERLNKALIRIKSRNLVGNGEMACRGPR
jgi:hypothetical protein